MNIEALLRAISETGHVVFHMDDRSTDFLKPIYDGKGYPVITGDIGGADAMRVIKAAKRVFMLGHGGPSGLFTKGFFAGDEYGRVLAQKDDGVYIWCNADAYAVRNKLSGLVSGMFISEVGEARIYGIEATQEEVDFSNDLFSKTLREVLDSGQPHSLVRERYTHAEHAIVKFNSERLYVFEKGTPSPVLHPSSLANPVRSEPGRAKAEHPEPDESVELKQQVAYWTSAVLDKVATPEEAATGVTRHMRAGHSVWYDLYDAFDYVLLNDMSYEEGIDVVTSAALGDPGDVRHEARLLVQALLCESTESELRAAAKKIKHSGDYGMLYYHPGKHEVHWTMADSDGGPDYTSSKEIERLLSLPGIKHVELGDEWSPDEEDGWKRLNEEKEDPDAWIGVDLDGTFARYDHWRGATHVGKPIKRMVRRVRRWVSHGQRVKIFTARADDEKSVNAIKKWLKQNQLPDLEITNVKDEHCIAIWDDKAKSVEKNTGRVKEHLRYDQVPPEPPEEPVPTVALGEIMQVLPERVQDGIMTILNLGTDEGDWDKLAVYQVQELRKLLQPFADELKTVGTIPEYFAYMLVYNVLPRLKGGMGEALTVVNRLLA